MTRIGIWINAYVPTVILIHASLLAWSASRHSPVLNEVGHLPAGISHWRYCRFDLYRVNPPLVRMVAAIPMFFARPDTDWRNYSSNPLDRRESAVGIDFVAANGFRTFWLYTLGRWACIPFSCGGAWLCHRWSRALYGPESGAIALALWCFSPTVLGHGSLIMPDVPAATMALAATYSFWRWLNSPRWPAAFLYGLVLGVAELTKLTLLCLVPVLTLMWILDSLCHRREKPSRRWLREGLMTIAALAVAVYVTNLGYGFHGSLKPLGSYEFRSEALAGSHANDGQCQSDNRFRGTWIGSLPVPLPMDYVQGIDAQKRDFEDGMCSYLRGEWRCHGWWYYYVYSLIIKEPLGLWLLFPLALLLTVVPAFRAAHLLDQAVVLIPLIVIGTLVSFETGINCHYRYIFPIFPYLLVWVSSVGVLIHDAQAAFRPRPRPREHRDTTPDELRAMATAPKTGRVFCLIGSTLTILATLSYIGSSLRHYPHNLSYFNELVGGPTKGHEHLLGSSLDWGQDLLYLKEWYENHPAARPFYFASYGALDPGLAGLTMRPAFPPFGPNAPVRANELDMRTCGPRPGWYAIDVYYLHGASGNCGGVASPHDNGDTTQFSLLYFSHFQPLARVGYSTHIYHITRAEANRVRRYLGLNEIVDE